MAVRSDQGWTYASGASIAATLSMRRTSALAVMPFFFSSRRRHTRFDCDWSSDVCSSDLWGKGIATRALSQFLGHVKDRPLYAVVAKHHVASIRVLEKCGFTIAGEGSEPSRSEERRVGKECRSRWSPYH